MRIRTALLAIASLLILVPSPCQEINASEEAITRIINKGILEGHDNKIIGGIGDAAAVIVTKVVKGKNLEAHQIDGILLVFNIAFGDVAGGPNSEPKTALFVLRDLELLAKDPQLLGRIAQTRQYVEEQFAKSSKRSAQN